MTARSDFPSVYSRLYPPVWAKCRRLLGRSTAAEDVAQETFLRFWGSDLREAQDGRAVTAWLYRTCTRLAIDVLRERRRTAAWTEVEDDSAGDLPCGVDPVTCVEARAAIRLVARSMPGEVLAAAVLCRVDGLAQPEAAAVLGVTERTVRRMLRRFDEKLSLVRKECTP